MTADSVITVIGAVVTLLGMAITIWQAFQARGYRNQIKLDIRKISIASVSERLKRAQDEIRRLPTSKTSGRGVRVGELIQKIREQFDIALNTLDADGPDSEIRSALAEGQTSLNSYEISYNAGNPNPQDVHVLQVKVQDAVSTLGSKLNQMEDRA